MFTHIYYFQCCLFLLFQWILPYSIIFFCAKDFFCHFLSFRSSGMNSFSCSTSAFVDWKISAGYRILSFFPLPLTVLKMHLHCLLTYIISVEKSADILSFAPLCVMCTVFLWPILRFSLHQLVLNNSIFVCLGVIFFSFLGVHRTS